MHTYIYIYTYFLTISEVHLPAIYAICPHIFFPFQTSKLLFCTLQSHTFAHALCMVCFASIRRPLCTYSLMLSVSILLHQLFTICYPHILTYIFIYVFVCSNSIFTSTSPPHLSCFPLLKFYCHPLVSNNCAHTLILLYYCSTFVTGCLLPCCTRSRGTNSPTNISLSLPYLLAFAYLLFFLIFLRCASY